MKTLCPNEEVFSDYLEGRLPDHERSKIEEHLSDCDICLQDLVVTRSVVRGRSGLQSDPVPPGVTRAAVNLVKSRALPSSESVRRRLRRFFAGLYSTLSDFFHLTTWGQWSLAPIRGSKKVISGGLIQRTKTFKEIEADIEIEKTGMDKALVRIKLPENMKKRESVRVTLKKGEREISSLLLNDGYVLFEDIPFGHFALSFIRDGEMLGTYHFEIKETRHGKR